MEIIVKMDDYHMWVDEVDGKPVKDFVGHEPGHHMDHITEPGYYRKKYRLVLIEECE